MEDFGGRERRGEGEAEKNKKKNKGRIEFPSRPLLIVNRLEIRKKILQI